MSRAQILMNVSITFAIRLLTAPTMKALIRANVNRDIQETGKSALKTPTVAVIATNVTYLPRVKKILTRVKGNVSVGSASLETD